MDIACCTDRTYLKYCITMLLSLFDSHRGEEVSVHLLSNGLQDEDIAMVRDVVGRSGGKLEVYKVDGAFLGSLAQGGCDYISPTTYARLFLADILPVGLDRVVYLDCDLIVVGSLKPLWELPLEEDFEIAAVEDSCSANPKHYARLQLGSDHRYFNAGVLLVNLSAWRARGFSKLVMEVVNSSQFQLDYADQDVLNILCAGRTKYLSFCYNLQEPMLRCSLPEIRDAARQSVLEGLSSPVVIHFTYRLKPWCYTSFHPYRKHFYYYFDQTAWSGERPIPSWRERLARLMWWGASIFKMVNTYHPLPQRMMYKVWRRERR